MMSARVRLSAPIVCIESYLFLALVSIESRTESNGDTFGCVPLKRSNHCWDQADKALRGLLVDLDSLLGCNVDILVHFGVVGKQFCCGTDYVIRHVVYEVEEQKEHGVSPSIVPCPWGTPL